MTPNPRAKLFMNIRLHLRRANLQFFERARERQFLLMMRGDALTVSQLITVRPDGVAFRVETRLPLVVPVHRRVAAAELVTRLKELVRKPGVGWLLLAVGTYKMGETLADAMFGSWMVRVHHVPKEEVALWLGTWGIVASLAGSFLGGVLATRLRLKTAVSVTGALRLIPLIAQWAVSRASRCRRRTSSCP